MQLSVIEKYHSCENKFQHDSDNCASGTTVHFKYHSCENKLIVPVAQRVIPCVYFLSGFQTTTLIAWLSMRELFVYFKLPINF
jgi:hypothetical protein